MKSIWLRGLLNEMNIVADFRYKLTPTEDTKIVLAAASLYRLFVNDKLTGYGPARAAHGYSRTDSYSLSGYAGKEITVTVEVHGSNVNSFYIIDETPFFACEIYDGGKLIAEAPDFAAYRFTSRVQKVRRFSFQRTFTEIYHLADCPAKFYCGKETADFTPAETEEVPMNKLLPRYVHYPRLNTLPVSEYVEYGKLGRDENARLWRDRSYLNIDPVKLKGFRPAELEEDSGEEVSRFTYERTGKGKADTLTAPCYQTADFGRTLTGFFKLRLTVKENCSLFITFDEILTDRGTYSEVSPYRNDCCNVIKYTLAAGRYEFISSEANSARFANICLTEGSAEIEDFGMVLYENPDAANYKFDYKDVQLNSIVEAAVNTFAQNAVDVLTDCPSRERAGWLCDGYFSARSEALFTGENIVEKSFLENYALCPQSPFLPEGMIPMCYPSDHNDGVYIPNWSMWYVLQLRNYVNRTGDAEMRDMSKSKVYGLVKFFEKYYNEYGLLENLESWVFIEWSKCNDGDYIRGVNFPSNMLWSETLIAIGELYGDASLIEKGEKMKSTIRELSFNGEFFEDNAVRDAEGKLTKTGHTTETAQYYAFFFGVATPESHPGLFSVILDKFGPTRDDSKVYPTVYRSNAFIGNYLRLELLLRYGYKAQVLQNCRDFFTKMAEMTGTLWEHSAVTCSLDHGFASMAAYYIKVCCE